MEKFMLEAYLCSLWENMKYIYGVCNEKQWEKATVLVNTHLWRNLLTFSNLFFCFVLLVSTEVTGHRGYVFLLTLRAQANRAIKPSCCSSRKHLLTNCHFIHQSMGKVLSRSYKPLSCKSAWSPNFIQSRFFLSGPWWWSCVKKQHLLGNAVVLMMRARLSGCGVSRFFKMLV